MLFAFIEILIARSENERNDLFHCSIVAMAAQPKRDEMIGREEIYILCGKKHFLY
jgi:hypothetical protein